MILVREALEEHAVAGEVVVIADGETAIHFIKKLDAERSPNCPDIVILDWNIPRRHGSEVLAFLRASGKCFSVPAVILTSSDLKKDREDAARLGASRYLRKPTLLPDFLALGSILKELAGA